MAIKISNNTIIDDNRNIVNAGIATAIFFDGYVPGDDKNYDVNTTLNNQKVNVALEGDLVIGSGVTFTVSTGTTVVLNPFDYENNSVDELLVNQSIHVGVTTTRFITESTGIGSVGITSTRLVGVGIITTNNIRIGQIVKPILGIIGAGTTITGIGVSSLTINPASLNTTIRQDINFSFGQFENKQKSQLILNHSGINLKDNTKILNDKGQPIVNQSGSVLQITHEEFTTVQTVSCATETLVPGMVNRIQLSSPRNNVLLIFHFSGVLDCNGSFSVYVNGVKIKSNFVGTDRFANASGTLGVFNYNDFGTYGASLLYLNNLGVIDLEFRMAVICGGCSSIAYINRDPSGEDNNGRSGLTLMEIAT